MNKIRFGLLAVILLAFGLRLYNLTYHSLWFDEAISVHWARQTVPRILDVGFTLVEDRLPPLYYLTLKGWTSLFGFSETSVRSLSVVFGVLLIPVMANISALLFNRRIARFTALLITLNPFLIWYSQEARMYAPAVLFSALTIWAFLRVIESVNQHLTTSQDTLRTTQYALRNTPHASRLTPHVSHSRRHLFFYTLLFILFAIAGLYTHLYTGFLLPALGLWLILSYPRAWRTWLLFAISGLVITLAFTPLAITTWRFSGEAVPGDPFSNISQRAWWLLQAFTIWKAPLSPIFKIGLPAMVALFTIFAYKKPQTSNSQSKIQNLKSKIQNPLLLTTLLLISPFIIANLLLFRNHLAFFGERYFIVITPWLLLLAAAGAENLGSYISHFTMLSRRICAIRENNFRKHGWENHGFFLNIFYPYFSLSVFTRESFRLRSDRVMFYALRFTFYLPYLLLVIVTLLPLPSQWSIPAAKEAWRQSVAYLATHAEPDHGILIHPDWVRYPFQFYFHGPGQTYAAFSTVTPQTALDGPLQGVVNGRPVIWLIQSHLDDPDPNHLVEQWFAARYPLVTELYPPGITLKGYAPGYQLDTLPSAATPANIQFENGLHLVGYQVDHSVAATDELFHPPSDWAHVILYWTAAQPVTQEATPYVHLVGPEGVWGANLERANDALKLYPPSHWPVENNHIIRHDVDVNLNPATPPGVYQLVVGLHGRKTQHSLTQIEVR